jgi:very-short-patch-repair endonuclease
MGEVKQTVRKLRKEQTESEKLVWEQLRNRKWKGYKFFRQHPIFFEYYGKYRFFVADFYSAELQVVIEIDGKVHDNQKEYDEYRTDIIEQQRIRVIRFTNEDVKNFESFLERMEAIIAQP